MNDECKAYHTDVQRIIDKLEKMNAIFDSSHLKEAMWMLANQSWQIKAYREVLEAKQNEVSVS